MSNNPVRTVDGHKRQESAIPLTVAAAADSPVSIDRAPAAVETTDVVRFDFPNARAGGTVYVGAGNATANNVTLRPQTGQYIAGGAIDADVVISADSLLTFVGVQRSSDGAFGWHLVGSA